MKTFNNLLACCFLLLLLLQRQKGMPGGLRFVVGLTVVGGFSVRYKTPTKKELLTNNGAKMERNFVKETLIIVDT